VVVGIDAEVGARHVQPFRHAAVATHGKGTTSAGGMHVNGSAVGSTGGARVAGYLVRSSAPTSRIAVKHTATGRRARTRRSSGLPGYAEACQVWGRGLIGSTRLAVVGEVATTTWSHLAGVPWLRR
jgi:hypothetical protein